MENGRKLTNKTTIEKFTEEVARLGRVPRESDPPPGKHPYKALLVAEMQGCLSPAVRLL